MLDDQSLETITIPQLGTARATRKVVTASSDDGPLGRPEGWTRIVDPQQVDTLLFTGTDSVRDALPVMTMERVRWDAVERGEWDSTFLSDQHWLSVASEPYRHGASKGWSNWRLGLKMGRSVVERSWVFGEASGICVVLARCSPRAIARFEPVFDSIVAGATTLEPSRTRLTFPTQPAGPGVLHDLVEMSTEDFTWLLDAAGAVGAGPAAGPERASRLGTFDAVDGDGHIGPVAKQLMRNFVLAETHVLVRLEIGGSRVLCDLGLMKNSATVVVSSGARRWVGAVHRTRASELIARFIGIGPATTLDLGETTVSSASLRARLENRDTPAPEDATPGVHALWNDALYRWVLAVQQGGKTLSTEQYLGSFEHGHYRMGASGRSQGASEVAIRAVPSSEVYLHLVQSLAAV